MATYDDGLDVEILALLAENESGYTVLDLLSTMRLTYSHRTRLPVTTLRLHLERLRERKLADRKVWRESQRKKYRYGITSKGESTLQGMSL